MYCPQQQKLFRYPSGPSRFGGNLSVGKRKTARPISVKESIHVVLRAEKARGKLSFLLPVNARVFYQLRKLYGARFQVKVYHFALVGNHAHLLIKAKTKTGFQNFLRVFAGQLAQRITKAKPGQPLKTRFWDYIAFSRIIPWGKAYETAKRYLFKNTLQGATIQVSWLNNSS